MKFDLHMHTTRHSPDSQMDPFDLVRQAVKIGLDGVVITEHDWLWKEAELDELRASVPELLIFGGVEVSAQEGHFLAYGIHDPFAIPARIGVADLCREVHRQGGAVVAAHPFRWGQPFDEILRDERPELDGLELMTNNMDAICREQAAGIWRERQLAGIGSSDAHETRVLGVCYTDFDWTIRNAHDLVEAIRSRRAVARDRTQQAGR